MPLSIPCCHTITCLLAPVMPMACNSLVDKLDALGWPLSLKQTLSTTPCTQERPKQDSRAAQATSPNAESLQPRSPRASVLTTRPEQEEEPFSQSSQDGSGLVSVERSQRPFSVTGHVDKPGHGGLPPWPVLLLDRSPRGSATTEATGPGGSAFQPERGQRGRAQAQDALSGQMCPRTSLNTWQHTHPGTRPPRYTPTEVHSLQVHTHLGTHPYGYTFTQVHSLQVHTHSVTHLPRYMASRYTPTQVHSLQVHTYQVHTQAHIYQIHSQATHSPR